MTSIEGMIIVDLYSWADLGMGRGGNGQRFSFEILYYFYRIPFQKNKNYLE